MHMRYATNFYVVFPFALLRSSVTRTRYESWLPTYQRPVPRNHHAAVDLFIIGIVILYEAACVPECCG